MLEYSYTLQKILHKSDRSYKDFELVFSLFLFFLARLGFRFLFVDTILPIIIVVIVVVIVVVVVIITIIIIIMVLDMARIGIVVRVVVVAVVL